jgi:hypothetical protein
LRREETDGSSVVSRAATRLLIVGKGEGDLANAALNGVGDELRADEVTNETSHFLREPYM